MRTWCWHGWIWRKTNLPRPRRTWNMRWHSIRATPQPWHSNTISQRASSSPHNLEVDIMPFFTGQTILKALRARIHFAKLAVVFALFIATRAASADILKIIVDDAIHPVVTERIERAIQEATRTHADALLIELRTPGGLVSATREIIHAILSSPVLVIIYVTPSGSNAASAGFFI